MNGHQKNGAQEYLCKQCRKRFNRRKGTLLEGLRTPTYVIVMVMVMVMAMAMAMAMAMYMCGVSEAMIADVTGKQEKTVER